MDGTPLSFQLWNNYFLKNTRYHISYTHPWGLFQQSESIIWKQGVKFVSSKLTTAQTGIFPQSMSQRSCVIMLTNVLVKPDWINLDCNEKLYASLVCQMTFYEPNNSEYYSLSKNTKIHACGTNMLFIGVNCIFFESNARGEHLSQSDRQAKTSEQKKNAVGEEVLKEHFSIIQYFHLVSVQFILQFNVNEYATFKPLQTKTFEEIIWRKEIHHTVYPLYNAYFLSIFPTFITISYPMLFRCKDGSYIIDISRCNEIIDCPDGSDEENCLCYIGSLTESNTCKYSCNQFNICICSDLYYSCAFSLQCLPHSKVCDGYRDCPNGEDEFCISSSIPGVQDHLLYSTEQESKIQTDNNDSRISNISNKNTLQVSHHLDVDNSTILSCVPYFDTFFPINKLCIYEQDSDLIHLKYCTNGAHLFNCTKLQCPGYFKCPASYCIPFHYICNGFWDFPNGVDEANCKQFSCPNLFKCKSQSKCLHFSKVCDQIKDCNFGDDELSCNVKSLKCPEKCICFSGGIVCSNIYTFIPDINLVSMTFFKCYACHFPFDEFHLSSFKSLRFINIKQYPYFSICFNKMQSQMTLLTLHYLDSSNNALNTLKDFCLMSMINLRVLLLQSNSISVVEEYSFYTLSTLSILDMSNNNIIKLYDEMFQTLHNIGVLNLTFNSIKHVSSNTFKNMPVNTVHSFNIKVCCLAGSWARCKVINDAYTNCDDLFSKWMIRFMCWSSGSFAFVLNFNALVLNIKYTKTSLGNSLLTFGLIMVDGFFGVYLLTTAVADVYYRGNYIGYELSWRSSLVCKVSSLLALHSMVTSPLVLCLIMISRYCVIHWPLDSRFLDPSFFRAVVVSLFTFSFLLCISFVVIVYVILGQNVPTSVCLLISTSAKHQSTIISLATSVAVLIQTISSVIVLIFGSLLLKTVLQSESIPQKQNKTWQTKYVSIQITVLTFTNLFCWIPSSVFFSLPYFGYSVSDSTLAWITIGVVPINSALNPIFYTFMTPKMRYNIRTHLRSSHMASHMASHSASLASVELSHLCCPLLPSLTSLCERGHV